MQLIIKNDLKALGKSFLAITFRSRDRFAYEFACIRKRTDSHFLSFNSPHDSDTGFRDFPRDIGIIIFSDNERTSCLFFSLGYFHVSLSKQM